MRQFFIFVFICLTNICAAQKANPYILNGTWIPVKQEMAGNILNSTSFSKQKLIILDSTYTVIAESEDKGIVKYIANKMDIYGKEGTNKGKHFNAIYKLKDGFLTICYNLSGDGYPEAFDTKGKEHYFMATFKK